jgi:hypothetical protein
MEIKEKLNQFRPLVIGFFNWHNPSSRTMPLGSTQPLNEMSTRGLPGDKGEPARKADNFTAICAPVVQKMWEPRLRFAVWRRVRIPPP